jgi:hypothetical protein
MRSILIYSIFLLCLTGCVQTQATMLASETYAPTNEAEVVIYLSEADIPGEFTKIAIISAQGESGWSNENQMYNAARKRAAKIGAHGVLLEEIKEPGSGAKVAAAIFGVGTFRRGKMIAIRLVDKQ